MIDLMKRLAELDAKNPNVVKEHGRTENLSELSRELAVRAFRAGEKKLDKKYTQAQQAIQSRQSSLDHPMDDPAVQRAQQQTNRFDAYIDKAAARERGMKESDDDLVGMVQSTIEDILSGAQRGQDMTDNIADELGDYFDAVQNSRDETLQQAYSMVRDAADTSPEDQAQAAQSALEMLSGGEQGVAEGSRTAKPGEHVPLNDPKRKADAAAQRNKMAADKKAEPGKKLADKIAKKDVKEGSKHASRPGTQDRPGSATQAQAAHDRKREHKAELGSKLAQRAAEKNKTQSVAEGSSGNYTFTTALNGMLGDDKEFEVTYYYDKGADAVTHGSLPSDGRPASVEIISVKDLETGQDVSKNTVGKNIWAEFEEAAEYDYIENHRQKLGECGMMGSGMSPRPHSPASINMTADSGAELTGMLKDIMQLAGLKQVTPQDLGHEHEPAVISAEPGISIAKVDDEPSIMRSMLDKLNPEMDDEEKIAEWDNEPTNVDDIPPMSHDAMLNKGMHNQDPAGAPGAGDGRHLKNNPIATPEETYESLMADYKKFISEGAKDAHEQNMDAAQREMDSREAEGEDMSNYVIDPKTYKIVKKK